MTIWNVYYARIRNSLVMSKQDVVAACRLGGLEITVSRAEGWSRPTSDVRRYVKMYESDFDAFTKGLPEWGRQVEAEFESPDSAKPLTQYEART